MFICLKQNLFSGMLKRYFSVHGVKLLDLLPSSGRTVDPFDVSYDNIYKHFKLILDVRSPHEYETDHLEGAINIPILDDMERSDVGKIYNKDNPIDARLLGSSLIMKNLSQYLQPGGLLFNSIKENIVNEKDRIIVYCRRGGQRSKAVAIVLSEIGLTKEPVYVLNEGYRAYRKHVCEDLVKLPNEITLIGLCGLTGTGKTKILKCLQDAGEIILNLEELAEHKGSVFGAYLRNIRMDNGIKISQLSQKAFDSNLRTNLLNICNINHLRRCKSNKPIVWIECESRNIGNIHLPQVLWDKMQSSKRIIIESNIEERIKHILTEYSYLTDKHYIEATCSILSWLSGHYERTLIDRWIDMANDGKFDLLVESLLINHYDPIYRKNREPYITRSDTGEVVKLYLESLETAFIQKIICSKLINLSKLLLK